VQLAKISLLAKTKVTHVSSSINKLCDHHRKNKPGQQVLPFHTYQLENRNSQLFLS